MRHIVIYEECYGFGETKRIVAIVFRFTVKLPMHR